MKKYLLLLALFLSSFCFSQQPYSNNLFELVRAEIKATYNHDVTINRKTLKKYGRNAAVSTTEVDVTTNGGTEVHVFTNAIDSLSSDTIADTNIPIYIEGMTINEDDLTFISQVVNTNASNGRTRVALTTPLAQTTRVRGLTTGQVFIYENTALTNGKPTDTTKIHNTLVPGDNTSLKASTAIASTNYFILTNYWATIGRTSGGTAGVDIRLKIATFGNAALGNNFYTAEVRTISLNQSVDHDFGPYIIIPPNSLISITAIASTGTQDVKAGFEGFFADINQ